jgi:hypothetical protein
MITTSSLAFTNTKKHPQSAGNAFVSASPKMPAQSHDSVTFSGKHQHNQQPKLNPKTILTMGLALLGLGTVANAFPVNKNEQSLQAAQPTAAPTPFALPNKRSEACPACTDFLPPEEEETSTSSSTSTSTETPQPSARRRHLNKAQNHARENLKQAKAAYNKAQQKTDEACPDRKSNLKKECKDAKRAEIVAAKHVGQAQAALNREL